MIGRVIVELSGKTRQFFQAPKTRRSDDMPLEMLERAYKNVGKVSALSFLTQALNGLVSP